MSSKFGRKFTCFSCGAKFYDLNKPNPRCPKCNANPEDDPNKGMPTPPPAEAAEEYTDDVEQEVEDDGGDEDEDEAVEDSPEDDY
jgi:hypothetical protein